MNTLKLILFVTALMIVLLTKGHGAEEGWQGSYLKYQFQNGAHWKMKGLTLANKEQKKEKDWCPTIAGNTIGYRPEFKHPIKKTWLSVPTKKIADNRGVPYPLLNGGIFETVGLMGYEQAQALAWMFAADVAKVDCIIPEVRVVPYEVVYNIKAREKGEG